MWLVLKNLISTQDDLLRILGEKHWLYEFLNLLSLKCSNLLFSKELSKEILVEANLQKSSGNTQLIVSCMSILVVNSLLLAASAMIFHNFKVPCCCMISFYGLFWFTIMGKSTYKMFDYPYRSHLFHFSLKGLIFFK